MEVTHYYGGDISVAEPYKLNRIDLDYKYYYNV